MSPQPDQEPANLRFLRRLVTTLTLTMILGLLTIVGLFVMRFATPAEIPMPDAVTLPGDARPVAVTRAADWFAVVTDDDRILIFGADGVLRQTVEIER